MGFEVRHDIPFNGQHGSQKYPWASLNVGSSFFVPAEKVGSLRSSATQRAKSTGQRFTVRREGNGYRCWRIA